MKDLKHYGFALLAFLAFGLSANAQITLIANGAAAGTPTNGTATTGTMNGTGGNFIAACVTTFSVSCASATVSDSVNGTWTQHGTNYAQSSSTSPNSCIWYKQNASVSSSMTVSAQLNLASAELVAAVFSNVATASALDQENGTGYNVTSTAQPGSITPSQNNELLISCTGVGASSSSPSISGNSYTFITAIAGGTNSNSQTTGMGYVVQTTATAANPTWNYASLAGAGSGGLTQESFKQVGGSGGSTRGFPAVF